MCNCRKGKAINKFGTNFSFFSDAKDSNDLVVVEVVHNPSNIQMGLSCNGRRYIIRGEGTYLAIQDQYVDCMLKKMLHSQLILSRTTNLTVNWQTLIVE